MSATALQDGEVVDGAQSIDDESFRAQLVAIIPSLRAFARGLCGTREMADDMAQDAMMRAWAARASYIPDTNFRAWIFRILRNNYYTAFRKNARFTSWDPEAAERLLVTKATQELSIEVADVAKALNQLPAQQREVLMMVAAGGASYEEAAEVIGCAVGTVKSRVSRGRAALEALIEGADAPDDAAPLPIR